MAWTPQQVADNLAAHNACPEGAAWSKGKDSDAIWASEDEFAAPYLFWWAVQNAGQPGWHSSADILVVLTSLMTICACDTAILPAVENEFSKIQTAFLQNALRFYMRLERTQQWGQPIAVAAFRKQALPVIKAGLEPTL